MQNMYYIILYPTPKKYMVKYHSNIEDCKE